MKKRRNHRNEKLQEIRARLEADPYINLSGPPKKERIQVLVEPHIVDAINDYLDDHEEELKEIGRGSRNKLLSGIISDWYEINLAQIKEVGL